MSALRRSTTLLLTATALLAAGCGGSGSMEAGGEVRELASSDAAEVLEAQRVIDTACGSDGSASAGGTGVGAAVATLASITEQFPNSAYETGNVDRAIEMRRVSEVVAEQLRRCGIPGEAKRLKDVVDSAS